MNKLFKLLKDILFFNRRNGSTSLLKRIAKTERVYILVENAEDKKDFGESAITLHDFKNIEGKDLRPILVDNHLLMNIIDDVELKIYTLKNELSKKDRLINNINNLVKEYTNHNHFDEKISASNILRVKRDNLVL